MTIAYELCRDDRITTCKTFSVKAISSIGSGALIADRDNPPEKKLVHTNKKCSRCKKNDKTTARKMLQMNHLAEA